MTAETEIVIGATAGGSGAWADVQPDVYDATVHSVKDIGVSQAFPNDGPRLEFEFALTGQTDEAGEPITLRWWCSQKLSGGEGKESNLWKAATCIGPAPEVGQQYRVSQLIGRPCRVLVEIKYAGTDRARPAITNILPPNAKAGTPRRAAPAPQAAAEPAELCCVPKCGGVLFKYDDEGNPFCQKHAA